MPKFSDELRGSEGEQCIVTDLRVGLQYKGTIEAVHEDGRKVDVRYTNGNLVRVGYSFVTLVGEEKP